MEFSPASQNGINPPDQLYTRLTPHLMVANTATTYWTAGLTIKVINTAPYPKTIPVEIRSQFTPAGGGSTSTVTVGEGYFSGATATIVAKNLGTGTNLLSAHWPGESRYQGFDYTMTTAITVLPGTPLTGGLRLTVSPNNYYGETVNLTLTSYNTPSLNGTTATLYGNLYQVKDPLPNDWNTNLKTLYKVNGFNWGHFMSTNAVWVNNATNPLPNQQQKIYRLFTATYTGDYTFKYSYDNTFNWRVDGTSISTATAYFDQYDPASVIVPLTQGQHWFEFDITNGPGATWNTNPAGFGAIVTSNTGTDLWNAIDHLNPATDSLGLLVSSTASIVTFVGNTATYSTQYLSTGTVAYYAEWTGQVLSNGQYYITTDSNTTSTQLTKHTLATPLTLLVNPNPGYITGSSTTATVKLTTTSTHNLNGTTATLYLNGASAQPLTFVNNTASTVVTFNSTGTYTVSAIWAGGKLEDNKYYDFITTTTSVAILPPQDVGGELSLTSNPSSPIKTFTTNLTATLTSGIQINTGTINFTEGTTVLGVAPVVNNTATISTVFATTGSHTITAIWTGQRINGVPYTNKQSTTNINVVDTYSTGMQILQYGIDINPNHTGGADVQPPGNNVSGVPIQQSYYNNAGWDSTSTSQWIQLSRSDVVIGSTLYVTVRSNLGSGYSSPSPTPPFQTINGSFVITGKQGNYYDVEGNWIHNDPNTGGSRQLWQNIANPLYYLQYGAGDWWAHYYNSPGPQASITSVTGVVRVN